MDRIVIFGGTGFLGRKLIEKLRGNFNITVVTRDTGRLRNKSADLGYAVIDNSVESYVGAVEDAYAVINLSGASIAGKRWSAGYKKILYDSRIDTTGKIVEAINLCNKKPSALISTSASGYYGNRYDEILTEDSGPGGDFLSKLCVDWENTAKKAEEYGVRTVMIRIGIVLDRNEGALPQLIMPFKFFAGGRLGNGRQWMPWVHIDDVTGIFAHAVANNSLSGPVNAVSPNPRINRDFTKLVGKILRRPSFFAVPGFALKIITGEFAEFLLGGQRILPARAEQSGYKFQFGDAEKALINLLT